MQFEELIPVIMERFTAFQTLWSLYITVVIGLLAYVAATATSSSSPIVRLLLILGFAGFAYVNLEALTAVRAQRSELIAIAEQDLKNLPEATKNSWQTILEKAKPEPKKALRRWHRFIDILIIIIIWLMPTILVNLRPVFRFSNKSVRPKRSQLAPAVISWNQHNEEWTLAADYSVESKGVRFVVPKDFTFDLASVPKLLWWIVGPFELSVVAPLVHDLIYRTAGDMEGVRVFDGDDQPVNEISRATADFIFLELMEKEGVRYLRRTTAYYAVHFFGSRPWCDALEGKK